MRLSRQDVEGTFLVRPPTGRTPTLSAEQRLVILITPASTEEQPSVLSQQDSLPELEMFPPLDEYSSLPPTLPPGLSPLLSAGQETPPLVNLPMDATYPMVGINCGSSTAADCGSTNGGSTTSNDSEDGTVTGKLLVFSRFYIGAAVVQGRECWKCITNPAITTASLDTSDLEEVSVTQLTDAFLQAFSAHSAQDYHLIGWGVRCFLKARDDDNWRAHGADDRVYVVFDKCTENTEGQGDGIGGL